ncbi:hypothetical protein [Bacillus wiedmannii]|uniref:hypothetical protein n=1 Tax=Bacillus wiedmannii TaxID=1890302 RepID=UPI000BF126AE|nr:hypothetical protein [Bacillus wiedmannii]PEM08489.1 hypothetical protein CN610_19745 [Bacillus wiedmannii]
MMTTTTKLTRGEILRGMENGRFPVGTKFEAPYGEIFEVKANGFGRETKLQATDGKVAEMKSFPSSKGWTQIIEPKFKVGDIVVLPAAASEGTLLMGKVTKVEGCRIYASYAVNNRRYATNVNRMKEDWIHESNLRHASNEEAKQLPTLMMFKEAGRTAVEYKAGDIVKTQTDRLMFVIGTKEAGEVLELVYEEGDNWADMQRYAKNVTPILLKK